jgi:hypothetical protein
VPLATGMRNPSPFIIHYLGWICAFGTCVDSHVVRVRNRPQGPRANDSRETLCGGKSPKATKSVLTKLLTSVARRIRFRTRTVGPNLPFSCSPVRRLILTSNSPTENYSIS